MLYRTGLQYKGAQNQFTVQGYTEPVYSTSVYRISLQYKGIQNQFTVQGYTEPVKCTGDRHKTQNQFTVHVQGWNLINNK